MRRSFHVSTVVLFALACGRGSDAPAADSVVLRPLTASLISETGGMKVPESVRYDPDLDVFYVSNIDGNPTQKDGKAFIAVIPADSTSVVRMLVEGGRDGVVLNAPKGLALVGDTLWVADIDVVRGFNRRTGALVASLDLAPQGALYLNDVATGPQGAIYVTDSGIRFGSDGSMTQPGPSRVFRIAGRTVTEVARGDALHNANGITWQDTTGVWLLAPLGSREVQTWSEGDSLPKALATGPGQYDGIEALRDGRALVTSWADSSVYLITHGSMTRLIGGVSAPADLGYDLQRGVIAIPRFNDGKVDFYQLKAGS